MNSLKTFGFVINGFFLLALLVAVYFAFRLPTVLKNYGWFTDNPGSYGSFTNGLMLVITLYGASVVGSLLAANRFRGARNFRAALGVSCLPAITMLIVFIFIARWQVGVMKNKMIKDEKNPPTFQP
jgi:hypothetical protein